MTLIRFIVNIVLAILVSVAIVALLFVGYGLVMSNTWESKGLDYKVAEEEGTPAPQWLWVEGEPLSYRIWRSGAQGDATPSWVVLVHGLQAEGSETWAPVAELLARRGATVLTVDLRGMGRSTRQGSAEDYTIRGQAHMLAVMLNELQVRQATLAGQGWGAAVVMQMAHEQPQFVDRLVLVAPQIDSPWQRWQTEIARLPYVGRAAVWLTYAGGPLWGINQRAAYADPTLMPSGYMQRARLATQVEGTIAAWQAIITSPMDTDLPDALADMPASALVLTGEGAALADSAQLNALVEALALAQLKVIPEAGRRVQLEQAGAVARFIDSVRR